MQGVVPEYQAMVDELTSGTFVAMEVKTKEDTGISDSDLVPAL